MTRQRLYLFFILILTIVFTISSCATPYKLKNGTTITRKEIIAEIETYKKNKYGSSYYNGKSVKIWKRTTEKTERNDSLYFKIDGLNINELSKPITSNNATVFFMKSRNDVKRYFQPDQINIFQPTTINDELFDTEITRIIGLLEEGKIKMSEIKANLNKDYDISVQYYKNEKFVEENVYKPEVIDLLTNKATLAVYTSEKAKVAGVTYISLIQNLGLKKINPTCNYLYIALK